MVKFMTHAWEELLKPMISRPKAVQVAALCCRETKSGVDVLMITSRGTGRWIIPKGWPIKGKDGAQSALQEAWEEAGVKSADPQTDPIGTYDYVKKRGNGTAEPVQTYVYRVAVNTMSPNYPESHQRERQWMPAEVAANLVHEPQLRDLLLQINA
ncbi:NUDIX hydrolase [Aliisedimentitalea scapharcae]|uniref:NUDIX hydrolase n=2 Tax=Aliisedimentitalea scapharcae TaxID=1524259 RepID=A0ABZ2XZ34_9RHOB|nr:NUDIX hydrolase [Rhodobacteraceae bacterium M382]